jgi:tetratricopeptide (TPR) repeat protein
MSESLKTLIGFLTSNPDNIPLLLEAAERSLLEQKPNLALELFTKCSTLSALPPKELNLAGLAAMQVKKFDTAIEYFQILLDSKETDPALYFNLAWSKSMLKEYQDAIILLEETTTHKLPQAAMLHIQLLHQLGEFEVAEAKARKYLLIHPHDTGLKAVISVLAMDIDDKELAFECACAAREHPVALTTLGTLALGEHKNGEALDFFDRAIAINPHEPRSWIGKGLTQLSTGNTQAAVINIDRGAEMFGAHLGSWIAAGWAYFLVEDKDTSRQKFEYALMLDDTFAETHGSLAVLDALEGNVELAKRRTKTAMRLDKDCFSAALALTLISSAQGNTMLAQKIFDKSMNTPIDESGRTLSNSLVRMGLTS